MNILTNNLRVCVENDTSARSYTVLYLVNRLHCFHSMFALVLSTEIDTMFNMVKKMFDFIVWLSNLRVTS